MSSVPESGRRSRSRSAGSARTTSRSSPSAVDLLTARLREEILDGRRAGGERLREQALAEAHEVARHTVRAALRQLAAEGYVTIAPNAGARVTSLSREDITDLSATRELLELAAVERILALESGRMPQAVHQAAARFATSCRNNAAWPEVVREHALFHEALVAAAGSPRLTRAHAVLSVELTLFLVQARAEFPPEALAAEHLALIDALEQRGPAALLEHLAASRAALLG